MNVNILIILISSAFAKTGRNRYQRYVANQRKINALTTKNIPKNLAVQNHTKFVYRKFCNVVTCNKCDLAISRGYRMAESCKVLLTVKNCCNNNLNLHALWKLIFAHLIPILCKILWLSTGKKAVIVDRKISYLHI